MIIADYLVMFAVLLCISVNRQSIFILCAFSVNECAFYLTSSDFTFSITAACCYAALSTCFLKLKYNLQMALICYSALFWFAGFDYAFFPQETYFYVIFPYAVKFVDVYVIYHLINKEQRNVRIHSTNHCSFN